MYHLFEKYVISHINFETLGILFCLMVVAEGLRRLGYIDKAARIVGSKSKSIGDLMMLLVLLCFGVSMLVTNDVALIIFVPFTVQVLEGINRSDKMIKCIVFETIAANLGSMVTPFGNPQNVYLYRTYQMELGAFLGEILPFGVLALVLLVVLIKTDKQARDGISFQNVLEASETNKKDLWFKTVIYGILFVLSILAVIGIVNWMVVFGNVIILVGIMEWKVLKNINYGLLMKFIILFILVGNVAALPAVSAFLERMVNGHEFLSGVLISQVISNVPAAILLSKFTNNGMVLMLGCNVGGLGTLIASMASIISLECYGQTKEVDKKKYVLSFTYYNILFLVAMLMLKCLFL